MRITKEGWAVIDGDTHLSKWVEETGDIMHGMKLLDEWKEYVPLAGMALDIGASIGDTTIPMATLVGPQGMVLAFEPLPEAHECLLHNLDHAGIGPWAFAVNKALGAEPGEGRMARSPNNGASHVSDGGDVVVQIITLDSFGFTKCNFIKIDVEGFELDVLAGAEQTIMRTRPIILVEIANHCHRFGRKKSDVLRWFLNHEYELSHTFDEVENSLQLDVLARPLPVKIDVDISPESST